MHFTVIEAIDMPIPVIEAMPIPSTYLMGNMCRGEGHAFQRGGRLPLVLDQM